MICPYMVNISLLLGGILSWGLAWPLIETKKGDWFISDQSANMQGLQGYKVLEKNGLEYSSSSLYMMKFNMHCFLYSYKFYLHSHRYSWVLL